MNATPLLTRILRALHEHRLEAVLIGNAAAAMHGAPVTTLDFDFMFRDTPTNLRKLKAVAADLHAMILRPFYPVSRLYRVVDDERVRSGPDLVPWLREERISAFCPPPTLLRAMGVEDPPRELPDLRFLYVGGEALPQDLSDRWSAHLRLENGYGPTECTVTVVRGTMQPGVPVHIGTAPVK